MSVPLHASASGEHIVSIDTDDGLTTRLERRLRRERSARAETERIAEEATTRLYALVNELAVFHDVLEQIPNPVAMVDATGSVTFLNAATRATLLVPADVAVEDIRLNDFYPKLSLRSLVVTWPTPLLKRLTLSSASIRCKFSTQVLASSSSD